MQVRTDEDTETAFRQQVADGQKAEELLGNELLVRWQKELEANCLAAADALPLADTAGRERAYTLLQLSRKLVESLKDYVENAHMSKKRLEEIIELKKQKKWGLL